MFFQLMHPSGIRRCEVTSENWRETTYGDHLRQRKKYAQNGIDVNESLTLTCLLVDVCLPIYTHL